MGAMSKFLQTDATDGINAKGLDGDDEPRLWTIRSRLCQSNGKLHTSLPPGPGDNREIHSDISNILAWTLPF
jgi:hypothetical protein